MEQNLSKIRPMKVVAQEAINYIEGRREHNIVSLKTRWGKLNKQCMGGIEPNTVYTIAGISGSGNKVFINCNHANLSILGTQDMLENIQHWLPLQFELMIYDNKNENVKSLLYQGKTAFFIVNYLYTKSNVYLERKYNKYLEYCRLYLEEYRVQLGKYGELWEENAVVNSEIAKGFESPYSVEIE